MPHVILCVGVLLQILGSLASTWPIARHPAVGLAIFARWPLASFTISGGIRLVHASRSIRDKHRRHMGTSINIVDMVLWVIWVTIRTRPRWVLRVSVCSAANGRYCRRINSTVGAMPEILLAPMTIGNMLGGMRVSVSSGGL